MNNDLEQFSEERLMKLIHESSKPEIEALARIALAAKQAKQVGYFVHTLEDGVRGMTSIPDDSPLVKVATPLYTTPQPGHTEQGGWKLVPEEATIAMLTLLGMTGSFEFMQQKYKNMLAATPKPESE